MALTDKERRAFDRLVNHATCEWSPPTFDDHINRRQVRYGLLALLGAAAYAYALLLSDVWLAGAGFLAVLFGLNGLRHGHQLRIALRRPAVTAGAERRSGSAKRAGWWERLSDPGNR